MAPPNSSVRKATKQSKEPARKNKTPGRPDTLPMAWLFRLDSTRHITAENITDAKWLARLANATRVDADGIATTTLTDEQRSRVIELLGCRAQFHVAGKPHGSVIQTLSALIVASGGSDTEYRNVRNTAVTWCQLGPGQRQDLAVNQRTLERALETREGGRQKAATLRNDLVARLRPRIDTEWTEEQGQKLLDDVGIKVLGQHAGGGIELYSPRTKRRRRVTCLDNFRAGEMCAFVGAAGAMHLHAEPGNPPDGRYTVGQVQRQIGVAAAAAKTIGDGDTKGEGVWQVGGKLLIVNGDTAFTYTNSGQLTKLSEPYLNGTIIELGGRQWAPGLTKRLRGMTAARARKGFKNLVRYFACWRWQHRCDPELLAGTIVAIIIQALFDWRPWMCVIAPSGTGKSWLCSRLLVPFFGAIWIDHAVDVSAAGLRQHAGNDARPIVIDEIQKCAGLQKILAILRTSSSSGELHRGTQDGSGTSTKLCHIPVLLGVSLPTDSDQGGSRILRFRLSKSLTPGKLDLPAAAVIGETGQELIAATIWTAFKALRIAAALQGQGVDGVDSRAVENHIPGAAMAAALMVSDEAKALATARAYLTKWTTARTDPNTVSDPDHVRALSTILAVQVEVQHGSGDREQMTVAQALGRDREGEAKTLARYGLRRVGEANREHLFVATSTAKKTLLPGPDWINTDLKDVLLGAPGAAAKQLSCGGSSQRGVLVPLTEASGIQLTDDDDDVPYAKLLRRHGAAIPSDDEDEEDDEEDEDDE